MVSQDSHDALTEKLRAALSTCDERLVRALKSEDIRLLRTEWLLAQPENYGVQRRQDLEATEKRGESPLLSSTEAVDLIRNGRREVAVLSYGWLLSWECDPTRGRLALLRDALQQQPHLKAVFWDQATLYQEPRSEEQNAAFYRALDVMGDLYASPVGTTVLQIKEMPPRPAEYDGLLCLGGAQYESDEELTMELQQFGVIESCSAGTNAEYRVKFKVHRDAERAAAEAPKLGVCEYAFIAFRDYDAYDDRGWCCFEDGVSGELLARLTSYPKMQALLSTLPTKMLRLASDTPPQEIEIETDQLANRVSIIKSRIHNAKFLGNRTDKNTVPALYEEFIERIATTLQKTLAVTVEHEGLRRANTLMLSEMPPIVDEPINAPTVFADGQLLLHLPDCEGRRAGGEGATSELSVVQGRLIRRVLAGGDTTLYVKDCSHVVLPWNQPAKGWASAFYLSAESLHSLHEPSTRLNDKLQLLKPESLTSAKVQELQHQQDEFASQMLGVTEALSVRELCTVAETVITKADLLKPLLTEAKQTIETSAKEVALNIKQKLAEAEAKDTNGRELDEDFGLFKKDDKWMPDLEIKNLVLKQQLQRLQQLGTELSNLLQPKETEDTIAMALRPSGAMGERQYAVGQCLTIRQPDGRWVDTQVSTDGAPPCVAGQEVPLHPWNHAVRDLPASSFEELCTWWKRTLRSEHGFITDALSGNQLDVLEHCVAINMASQAGSEARESRLVQDARSLSEWLCDCHAERCKGEAVDSPAAAVLVGLPATGKTTLLSQIIIYSLDTELVPILIKVQRLQRRMIDQPDAFDAKWNWIDAYLELEYHRHPAVYHFLRQALFARRALLLIDGLDEAGAQRSKMELHVTAVLARQGHVLLCTTRPAGMDESRFAEFRRFELAPLSDEQQQQALKQRLGAEQAETLLEYLATLPQSLDTNERITANPLMLSMVASVYQLRQGLGMPKTVMELYEHASDAMLERGAANSKEHRRLLQATFFEAHALETREFTKYLLAEVARKARVSDAVLTEVCNCALQDKLPLLSLLEAEPLQLQSSHLSFQEYFVVRSLCEAGMLLSATPPFWKWSAWWANVVKLGKEKADSASASASASVRASRSDFGQGLLRAAGVEGSTLNLEGQLGRDRPTVLAALTLVLKFDYTLTELSLAGNQLGEEGGNAIARIILENGTLVRLDLSKNCIGPKAGRSIAEALEKNNTLTDLNLMGNGLGAEGGAAIAEALTKNTSLTSVNLAWNRLGAVSGKAILEMLRNRNGVAGTLTEINLAGNQLGKDCVKALKALEIAGVLPCYHVAKVDVSNNGDAGDEQGQMKSLIPLLLFVALTLSTPLLLIVISASILDSRDMGLLLSHASSSCPDNWTAVPNASWPNQCFGVPVSRSSSLRSCITLCGAEGGVPACISLAEENTFAAELVGADWAWLGLYRNDSSGGPEQGWRRCVGGDAPLFTSWADGQPNDDYGPEDCALMSSKGVWLDQPCLPSALRLKARCLCAGPANASAALEQDLEMLEERWEESLQETKARVVVACSIAALLALLPLLLLLCRRLLLLTAAADEASKATASKLRAARRSAAQRRLQVMLQLGWALIVFGVTPLIMWIIGRRIDAVVGPMMYWATVVPLGLCVLLLALLPTDERAIRTVCAVWFAFFLSAGLYSLPILLLYAMSWPLPFLVLLFALAVLSLATAAALAPTLCCNGCTRLPVMQPRQALRWLWRTARFFMGGVGVLCIGLISALIATHPSAAYDPNNPATIALGALFLAYALLATPRNRGRLHRRLGRLGGRGSEEEEAAAITTLITGADPDKALADAAELFCCIFASSLTADDLAGSGLKGPSASPGAAAGTSAEELAKKTVKARHGEVTCFFSHSWRDEEEAPGAKFEALQRWARRYKEKTGAEATLWLDKACIDTIDPVKQRKGINCLPIFLAGCQTLLIVAGPTYCSRLWCVMEIFTFMRMGGTRERIEVKMLMELKEQFATFDAAKAECFLPRDKHRLLAVVEAGFGDLNTFSLLVRSIFDDRLDVEETAKTLVPKARVQPEEKYEVTWVEDFDSTSSTGAALASSPAPATAKVAPAPPA